MIVRINKEMYWIIGILIAILVIGNAPEIMANSSLRLPYDKQEGERVHKAAFKGWDRIVASIQEEEGDFILGEDFQSAAAILSVLPKSIYENTGLAMYNNYIYQVDGKFALTKDAYYPTVCDDGFEISKVYISKPLDALFSHERYLVVEEAYTGEERHMKRFKRKNYYIKNKNNQWIYQKKEGVTGYHGENVTRQYLQARGIIDS